MKKLIFSVVFLSAFQLAQAQVKKVDGIIAVVGEKIIILSNLEDEEAQLLRTGAIADTQAYRCAMLEKLIVKQMMLNQAELDSIPLDEERVEAEIENRLRFFQRQAGSQADLEKYLGKTLAEYKEEIRPKMREQLLVQEMENMITSNIQVSPQEVKQFFDTIPKDSIPIIPTEVEVAQLIIAPPISDVAREFAKAQLEDIRIRILNGEPFEKFARTYSEDPESGKNGGILPEFGRGDMVPEFERMAFKLKTDTLSPVFESDYGYHLMQVMERHGERVLVRHILIRPQNTSADYVAASAKADSIYKALTSNGADWCTLVKKFQTESMGDRANCGFLKDETTGSQKVLFELLPDEIKVLVEKMAPGTYSMPTMVRTPDGRQVFMIIYLKEFIPPHQANIQQDYGRIRLEAEAMKKQKAVEAWVEKNRKHNYIRIHSDYVNCSALKKWENQN